MKIGRILLMAAVILSILGCNLAAGSRPAGDEQPDNPAGSQEAEQSEIVLKTKELASEQVSVSAEEQAVSYNDEITVRLPGGVVNQAGTLRIARVTTKIPPPVLGGEDAQVFEISLEGQDQFDQPVTIEFPVDPEKLNPELPPDRQAFAAYWDVEGAQWISAPAVVDAAARVARVQTNHFSVWSMYYWARGYETDPTAHFIFIYDRNEVNQFTRQYDPLTQNRLPNTPTYITDLMELMEKEYAVYLEPTVGFVLPEPPIIVHVGNYTDAQLMTITGNIRIPYDLQTLDDMRHTTAHELFHAVQLRTLTTTAYAPLQWWMDATADYAADAVAWASAGGTGKMGADITGHWLETSLNARGTHAYGGSRFVEYLVSQAGLEDFRALWMASISDIPEVIRPLEAFVQQRSGTSLGMHYTNYTARFAFNPLGPCKVCNNVYNDIATRRTPWLVERGPELVDNFSVPYYAAKIWGIQNQNKDRTVLIERLDGNYGTVAAYILPRGDWMFETVSEPAFVTKSEPATLNLKSSDYLFIIMDNTISPSSQDFNIRVSEVNTPPVGKYRLYLQYADLDCGSDVASGLGWTWVLFDGKTATISYESSVDDPNWAPGAEHTVTFSGSGKVVTEEVKGVTYNYLELTLSGIDDRWRGSASVDGTLRLRQYPDWPSHWEAPLNRTDDEVDGTAQGWAELSIPPDELDQYPGKQCSTELVGAYMDTQ